MSWGKIYCDTNWGENKYRTAGSIINEATPDCFQFPEFVSFKDHVRSEGATYEKMQCGIDILLFLGRSISITPQSPDNPTFSGILDTYTGATAGYSTRRLTNTYTGGLIRVRRSSDDAEQDIGYDANGEDLDTFGLLAFVNAERDIFTSDFPNGTTAGSGDGELGATRTTLTAPSSIGGETDALQVTCDGTVANYDMRVKFTENGQKHDVSFQYYIPSGNTIVEGITWTDAAVSTFNTKGVWTSVNLTDVTINNSILRFFASTSTGTVGIGSGVTESFYIRNLSVSQTTADGYVTTFYDQTGNGNHATNSTASEQPLIVDGGSIIYEGATISRPAIEFDGVDDKLSFELNLNIGGSPSIIGVLNSAAGDIAWRAGGSDYWYFQGSQLLRYRNGDFDASWINSDGLPVITGSQKLIATYKNSISVELSVDGRSIATKESGTGADGAFNHIGSNGFYMDGVWQELIVFNSDQSSNRTGIEGNIDNYFRIT